MKRRLLIWFSTFSFASGASLMAVELNSAVASWLAAQTNVHSWSADFVQTRSLKSLTKPLTEKGHVWFEAPNRFRWELGNPALTIAVRGDNELEIIYPRFKRVERIPLSGDQAGPWKDALSLLEAGFPRSAAQLESQYDILEQTIESTRVRLLLQPKSAAARRMMPKIEIEFEPKDFALKATELQIADGSVMRNDFGAATLNPSIDPELLSPKVPSDYKMVEPLKGSK